MSKVYFLGAGATKAVAQDAPLNNEILEAAFSESGHHEISEEIEEIKTFLKIVFHDREDNIPRLGDILSFIDFSLREKTISIKNYHYEDFIRIRNSLVRLIAIVLKNNLIDLNSPATEDFVRNINENDSIISTNYDIVIDNALLSIKKNTNYGVKIRENILPLEFSDDRIRAASLVGMPLNIGPIKLLKLHGSLNWLYCPKCDEVDITLGQKGVAEYINKEYELLCFNKFCTSHYEPLIVTPTKFKAYENRLLNKIWGISQECISKADELVFIGYSLPEADTEIRCLLLNGINMAEKKPKITFVDRPERSNDVDSYKRLFGEVNYMPVGFIKYIEEM